MTKEQKISTYLHEYGIIAKKIEFNDIYLKDNQNVLNFQELETTISIQRILYIEFQKLIENEIINLNTNI
tara:strand:+ start:470 stop:679 length:210 start_codon:yes stop_codon:yes gene_type:complete